MTSFPADALNKDVSKNFRRDAGGYVQQRVPGAFELDCVSLALRNLLLQGSYRVDVDLMAHSVVQQR